MAQQLLKRPTAGWKGGGPATSSLFCSRSSRPTHSSFLDWSWAKSATRRASAAGDLPGGKRPRASATACCLADSGESASTPWAHNNTSTSGPGGGSTSTRYRSIDFLLLDG